MKKLILFLGLVSFLCANTALAQDTLLVRDGDGNILMLVLDEGTTGAVRTGRFIAGSTTTYGDGFITLSDGTNLNIDANTFFIDNASNRVGIGTTTPNEQLEITGNFRLPATDTAGDTVGVIFSDGNPFIHNFGANNFFAGVNAGNLTPTGWLGFLPVCSNTGVGENALSSLNTGLANTAVGVGALEKNTEGSKNTALGFRAGINLITGDDNIDIGNEGVAAESSTIRMGTAGTHTRTFIAGITGVTVSGGIPVLIKSNGQLGTTTSSRRFKKDIRDMADATRDLMKLRPVLFIYKNDSSNTPQYGLIAEEVAEIYPELVVHSADGQIETVRYHLFKQYMNSNTLTLVIILQEL